MWVVSRNDAKFTSKLINRPSYFPFFLHFLHWFCSAPFNSSVQHIDCNSELTWSVRHPAFTWKNSLFEFHKKWKIFLFLHILQIKYLFFNLWEAKLFLITQSNSQAPERSRGPRVRCARSSTNGEVGARSLRKIDQSSAVRRMLISTRNSQIFF